jgi:predicted nucleic acid-binding protein
VTRTFLDASYVIALEWRHDQSHSAAITHWSTVSVAPKAFVTTSFVIDEVVTFFATRGMHRKAVEVGDWLLSSPALDVVWVNEEMVRDGFEYLKRRTDKRYSLTDCISFVLMDRLDVDEALTFDTHFEQAGFVRLPRS